MPEKTPHLDRLRFWRISALLLFLISSIDARMVRAQPGNHKFDQIAGVRLIRSDDTAVLVEFSLPEYSLDSVEIDGKDYQKFSIPFGEVLDSSGMPQVPAVGALIAVPPQADLKAEILVDEITFLGGHFAIAPSRIARPIREDFQSGDSGYSLVLPDTLPLENYPETAFLLQNDAWLRDQRLVQLSFYPFQYSSARGGWIWHRRIRVQISFEGMPHFQGSGGPFSAQRPEDDFASPLMPSTVLNAESARYWSSLPAARDASYTATSIPEHLEGPRYRIAIDQDGTYRLSYATLQSAGLPVNTLDPTTFALASQGDPVAIHISDADGDPHKFSSSEEIIFYGQRFSGELMAQKLSAEDDLWMAYPSQLPNGAYTTWKPQLNALMLEKYTRTNVYWLTYGGNPGPRMTVVDGTPDAAPISQAYRAVSREERQIEWKTTLFSSEETWYWEKISTSISSPTAIRSYTTTLTAPASGIYTATIQGEIAAETTNDFRSPDHHIQIFFNDENRVLPPVVDATWDGKSRYHFTGQIPQSRLLAGVNRIDLVTTIPLSITSDTLYFDWFKIEYDHQYQALENQITFGGENAGTWRYQVSGYTSSDLSVLEVTTPLMPSLISHNYSAGTITFERTHAGGAQFTAGKNIDLGAEDVQYYSPPDFDQPVDYIFISHRDLITGAQALANYRIAQGISARVYDLEDVIRQFNFGIYSPYAIKTFLAYAYTHWAMPPKYVMLVGDGHWNFINSPKFDSPPIFMPPLLAWVDPWQGEVDSANLLATVVGTDPLPDVYISRLPVNSSDQLQAVVDKIIAYEAAPAQEWQHNLIFAADDTPDYAGDFVALTEAVIADYATQGWSVSRVFLDNYIDTGLCENPTTCIAAMHALTATMSYTGGLVISYSGHGDINRWASPSMLQNTIITSIQNASHLPIVLSMTCLDGYWIHPNLASSGRTGPGLIEELLRQDHDGVVAAFSPTGLGVATGHDSLQRGFLDILLGAGERRLGPASISAKLAVFATGINYDLIHTFTVFGDPALRIPASPPTLFLPNVRR